MPLLLPVAKLLVVFPAKRFMHAIVSLPRAATTFQVGGALEIRLDIKHHRIITLIVFLRVN